MGIRLTLTALALLSSLADAHAALRVILAPSKARVVSRTSASVPQRP
jgi:hypothetical protein